MFVYGIWEVFVVNISFSIVGNSIYFYFIILYININFNSKNNLEKKFKYIEIWK